MLNYTETMEEIKNLQAELGEIKNKTDSYDYRAKCRELYLTENLEALHDLNSEYTENCEKEKDLELYIKAHIYNAEKLFLMENFKKILDIINEYSGKRCGEKTTEKIRSKVKEICNCSIYLNNSSIEIYRNELTPFNAARTTIYMKYIDGTQYQIFNNENKLNELMEDMFHLPEPGTVIDNVVEYTEQKKAEFEELKKMYKQLEEATENYNKNNPFKHQVVQNRISYID